MLIGGIDAGGTTFKCAVFEPGKGIIARQRVPTTDADRTVQGCIEFFKKQTKSIGEIGKLGIGSFGPLNVDEKSSDYGKIGDTPKAGWSRYNLKRAFETGLRKPVVIDTDVNAALLGEIKLGAAKGCASACYTTIGTGIGSGFYTHGQILGRPNHPEFGHIRLNRHEADQSFGGVCSFHGDCLEGLASAPAITQRFGDPTQLDGDHIAWDIIGYYLAQGCLSQFLTLRPERIILGGGVMLSSYILGKVHSNFEALLNGYLDVSRDDIENMIVKPALGDDAGLLGAIQLAL